MFIGNTFIKFSTISPFREIKNICLLKNSGTEFYNFNTLPQI